MLSEIVNVAYVVVIVVYAIPFVATLSQPGFEASGLADHTPAWMQDESWKGFWLSPFRMFLSKWR